MSAEMRSSLAWRFLLALLAAAEGDGASAGDGLSRCAGWLWPHF
jgi:hypothetical protein